MGDVLVIETPGGKQRELRIAGRVRDLYVIPPLYQFTTYGYITFDTLEWLGEPCAYNRLYVTVAERALDEAHIQQVVAQVKRDRVEKNGQTVYQTEIRPPGEPPLNFVLGAMVLILGVMSGFALLLGGFLVINTISALLARQVRQIGIMKAIGARTRQIAGLYLVVVLSFGLLALIVPLPLGALGARAFAGYMAAILNLEVTSFDFPPHVVALEAVVSLLVPLAAALYPLAAGTRMTVREAISTYGLGQGQFGTDFIDQMIVVGAQCLMPLLPRPLLLSLRNAVRRKGRLAFTLIPLTLASAAFIAVFSVRASMLLTLDDTARYWQYDVEVHFSRAYRAERVEREALRVQGVVKAECWNSDLTVRLRADDSESGAISLVAPPAATSMIRPIVLQGRWLLPEDEHAVVVNTILLKEEPDVAVGHEVVLKIRGRESTWRVVGVVEGGMSVAPVAYVNAPAFARVAREVGRANGVHVVTAQHDEAFQSQVERRLEEHFQGVGLHVNATQATARLRATIGEGLGVFAIFLLFMAILLAVVGGLGLMGTMSLSVLERTREIGVLRAIGASNGTVLRIVAVEAILIGVLSWFLGAVLALPVSKLLSDQVGLLFFNDPLSHTFSVDGVLAWFVAVVVLSALASFLPARNAARLTVRKVLAYE